jgi:hypothetical protein
VCSEVNPESQASKMLHGSIGLSDLCLSQVLAAIIQWYQAGVIPLHRACTEHSCRVDALSWTVAELATSCR